MKRLTIYEVAQKLIEEGNKITLYKRKDGGYLITSINGVKYTGAKGNNLARELTGSALSEKQINQRIKLTETRLEYERRLGKEIKKQYNKTRRAIKRSKMKAHITLKQTNQVIKNVGYQETFERLTELERHAQGYSYAEYVEYLIEWINSSFLPAYEGFQKVINYMVLNKYEILHKSAEKAHDLLYELAHKVNPDDNLFESYCIKILNVLKRTN